MMMFCKEKVRFFLAQSSAGSPRRAQSRCCRAGEERRGRKRESGGRGAAKTAGPGLGRRGRGRRRRAAQPIHGAPLARKVAPTSLLLFSRVPLLCLCASLPLQDDVSLREFEAIRHAEQRDECSCVVGRHSGGRGAVFGAGASLRRLGLPGRRRPIALRRPRQSRPQPQPRKKKTQTLSITALRLYQAGPLRLERGGQVENKVISISDASKSV